jgi:hypothetical protein
LNGNWTSFLGVQPKSAPAANFWKLNGLLIEAVIALTAPLRNFVYDRSTV